MRCRERNSRAACSPENPRRLGQAPRRGTSCGRPRTPLRAARARPGRKSSAERRSCLGVTKTHGTDLPDHTPIAPDHSPIAI